MKTLDLLIDTREDVVRYGLTNGWGTRGGAKCVVGYMVYRLNPASYRSDSNPQCALSPVGRVLSIGPTVRKATHACGTTPTGMMSLNDTYGCVPVLRVLDIGIANLRKKESRARMHRALKQVRIQLRRLGEVSMQAEVAPVLPEPTLQQMAKQYVKPNTVYIAGDGIEAQVIAAAAVMKEQMIKELDEDRQRQDDFAVVLSK